MLSSAWRKIVTNESKVNWHELLQRLLIDVRRERGEAPDEEAWTELFQWLRLYGLTVLRPKGLKLQLSDIEDLVHDLILRLHDEKIILKLLNVQHPERYLSRTIWNTALDRYRKHKRNRDRTYEWADVTPMTEDPREKYAKLRRWGIVKTELEKLTKDEKCLLHMVFWRELSFQEIARELQIKHSTVSTRLFRLLRKLRKRIT